ncbi:SDR family NAD(P)-dependent oxidoreductase [Plastoroseomonas arctica]|uniref:SDR family NAD(P)-dependent oxidoreductase n=1 Tax=Plastoroseomonas arctica TaxID=1509237 RepID=A0AAF1K338_9PROT|nr:SDR family NAD(P)-dependent oxidoreductase [Plastoroseomonas arctica]MBR0655521.1 SDR family NAD(P)-dependent oxidoreductase [Plastoroseomonas arctica]
MSRPVCAIVGFGAGVGAAVARRFAAGGFDVLGLARDPSRHAGLAGPGIKMAMADAADPSSLAQALPAGTEVLVYNAYAATMAQGGPSSLSPEAITADFAVNVAGALAAARAVLPGMRAAVRGTILFTGGGLALDPTGWLPAASLAIGKAGLRSLAQTLHAELAPQNIHAGTVTIAGTVAAGTAFDPDRIAEAFWDLHSDPPGGFRAELIFRG